MNTYEELGRALGALVDRKNRAYGSSFEKAGPFLQLLYPEGIRPDQMTDALLLVRIFDKQVRIATGADSFGESPYQDIAGYGLLGTQLHQENACQGSANGQDAPSPPEAQPASAPQPTSAKTITSANEPNVQPSSPSSNASCANTAEPPNSPASTPAPLANPKSQSAADLAYERNMTLGWCGLPDCAVPISYQHGTTWRTNYGGRNLLFCSKPHAEIWMERSK